jgi:tRNA pseudouridine55 synthase
MVQYDGILLCNKPYGISSHDVISNLRQIIGQKRIGHTGTLDPRATGLLLICLGRATKIAQFLADVNKTYEAEIKLGIRSRTFDSEGIMEDEPPRPVPVLTESEVVSILAEFKGAIKQKVPVYSAVKVGGRRLYKVAREGKTVDTPERDIEIIDIGLTKLSLPVIGFNVCCSKGTYIRALANDIGERIGCGAYLSRLNRTRIGNFILKDALNLNEIKYYRQAGILKRYLKPIESILPFPFIRVNETFSSHIIAGRSPKLKDIAEICGEFRTDDYVSLMDHNGLIMAVGKAEVDSAELKEATEKAFFTYVRVLN